MTTQNEGEWIDPIFDAVVSDVQASAYFDRVNKHEPKRKPGYGLTAAVWFQGMTPLALASGLAKTSARITFVVRCYVRMMKEPADEVDPQLMRAVSNIMRRYHGDYDFGGVIRNVDLLGHFGVPLEAIAGYLDHSGQMFRVVDITVPCIVNDVWPQVTSP